MKKFGNLSPVFGDAGDRAKCCQKGGRVENNEKCKGVWEAQICTEHESIEGKQKSERLNGTLNYHRNLKISVSSQLRWMHLLPFNKLKDVIIVINNH